MMRAALVAGAMMLAFASPSFAQMGQQGSQGSQGFGQGYTQQGQSSQSGQSGMMGGQNEESQAWAGPTGRGPFAMLREERMEHILPMMSALANGTFYRFKRGDDEVDIHCPARASIQDCINGANNLMRTLQQTGSAGGGSSQRQ